MHGSQAPRTAVSRAILAAAALAAAGCDRLDQREPAVVPGSRPAQTRAGADLRPGTLALVDAFPAQERFALPVWLDWHPSDARHYYVVEQHGRVLRVPRDGGERRREVFLDWTAKTYTAHNEEGLLGFAFDPDHAASGAFFVYYSHGLPRGERESVISRLVAKDGRADPESERVVLRIPQPAGNHNGGTILFGPDRMLYVALGDGGAAGDPWGNAQNRKALLGKVLRIDVLGGDQTTPYRIPPDNPFVGRADAAPEVWCYGMRNPWRMSFDRATGELWCADVGQDLWEEVDRLEKGKSHGWNLFEGTHPYPPRARREGGGGHVPPVAEYSHQEGQSITGGYVYRGQKIGWLAGAFVYGDYVSGKLWCVREQPGRTSAGALLLETRKAIASFAEEPDGELLLLCFDGRIRRLVPR